MSPTTSKYFLIADALVIAAALAFEFMSDGMPPGKFGVILALWNLLPIGIGFVISTLAKASRIRLWPIAVMSILIPVCYFSVVLNLEPALYETNLVFLVAPIVLTLGMLAAVIVVLAVTRLGRYLTASRSIPQ